MSNITVIPVVKQISTDSDIDNDNGSEDTNNDIDNASGNDNDNINNNDESMKVWSLFSAVRCD